jgi:tetratricopeptide (TPR) repeat protein
VAVFQAESSAAKEAPSARRLSEFARLPCAFGCRSTPQGATTVGQCGTFEVARGLRSLEAMMSAEERLEGAGRLYERFVFAGDQSVLAAADRELDAVEADLALSRGRIIHGRFLDQRSKDPEQTAEDPRELALFERALQLYQAAGDVRGEAESLFWVGCFQQVVRRDNAAAVPVLQRCCELAARVGDQRTMSDALRHLGIAEHAAGRLDAARQRLEESLRLRREIGLMPGVAANLVGLTYIAAGQGRPADALALAAEAAAIAEASGAHAILRQVEEARAHVSASSPPPKP